MREFIENYWPSMIALALCCILVSFFWIIAFQPSTKQCETAIVVDKVFTGRDNDIPTIFAQVDKSIIDGRTDNDTFFSVEKGDQINYCQFVGKILPTSPFTDFERIER